MMNRVYLALLITVLAGSHASAQLGQGTSNIQAGGGWTSLIIESTAETAKGFIANGMYEIWLVPKVGIGGSVHYLRVKDEHDGGSGVFTSVPLYLNGKYYFGEAKFRIFVMGSLGFQFSGRKLEDAAGNSGSDNDVGFTGGFGTGVVYSMSPKLFLNLNYSLYLIKNDYYSNGLANTFSLNLGYILGN